MQKVKKVLDVACGTRYGAHYLLGIDKAESVSGVDMSEEAIEYAKGHYDAERL